MNELLGGMRKMKRNNNNFKKWVKKMRGERDKKRKIKKTKNECQP